MPLKRLTHITLFSTIMTIICAFSYAATGSTPQNRHYAVSKSTLNIIYESGNYWHLNGNRLDLYRYEDIDGAKQLRNIRNFDAQGKVLGLEKDRLNIYLVSSREIVVIPVHHQSHVTRISLEKAGLTKDITGFDLGSRLLVYNNAEISGYDPNAEKWTKIKFLNLSEGEKIRHVIERYGLLVITTNKTVRLISTTNDDFKRLEIPELEAQQDLLINDFLVTGKVSYLWFAAVKMVLKIELDIDTKKKSVAVASSENLSPFKDPNISNIKRMAFWRNYLILFYDDGVYAFDPSKSQWTPLIANPDLKQEKTPVYSFNGKIHSADLDKNRLIVATSNQGVLSVEAGSNGFSVKPLLKTGSLPTSNIDDAVFDDDGHIIVTTGDGIYRCAPGASSCSSLREASFYSLPAYPETEHIKSVVRFNGDIVYISNNKVFRFDANNNTVPQLLDIGAAGANLPFLVLANSDQLFVLTPEKVLVFDGKYQVVKTIEPSFFKKGKRFDAEFSAGAITNDTLLLGMKKKSDYQSASDENVPDHVQKKRDESPDKFIQALDNVYLLDTETFAFNSFGRNQGLYTKSISSAIEISGRFFVLGHDIKSGKMRIYGLDDKQQAWNPVATSLTDQRRLDRIVRDAGRIAAYYDEGAVLLDTNVNVIATLTTTGDGNDKDYPGRLLRADGFFNHSRFGFYSGSSFRYFDRKSGDWGFLSGDTTYGFQPLGGDEIAVYGPDTIRILRPDVLDARLTQNNNEKDFIINSDDLAATHRPRSERRTAALTSLFTEKDVTYDIHAVAKPGASASEMESLIAGLGGTITDTGRAVTGDYFITLDSPDQLQPALNALTQSPSVAFAAANPLRVADEKTQVISDELILTFAADADPNDIDVFLKKHSLKPGPRTGQHTYVVYAPEGKNIVALSAALQREPLVRYSELNFVFQSSSTGVAADIPNDPEYPKQWHLDKIGFGESWKNQTPFDISVAVAVIDTGVDASHPDLAGRVLDGPDFVDLDNDADDAMGHGTHVAGVIAAGLNNAMGVSGLCGNCGILRVRVADEKGYTTTSDMAEAIRWVANDGRARVINISMVGIAGTYALWDAVKYADSKGVIIVAPAGNDGMEIQLFPAAFPEVIAVAATDKNDAPAAFSNFGPHVDVAAPGVDILSTLPGGGYGVMSGTSSSAAIVSGLIAAHLSRSNQASTAQIKTILFKNAVDIGDPGRDPRTGWGRVNAAAFLSDAALQEPLLEYFADYTVPPGIYEELPASIDFFVTTSWFSEALDWLGDTISDIVQAIVDAIVEAVKAIIEAVGIVLDFLYKQVLRPILRFFCAAACPIINFAGSADKAFKLVDISKSITPYFSVAATFCAVGCPALTAVGVIQPYTRLVCSNDDPTYAAEENIVNLPDIVMDETDSGPFRVVLRNGDEFEVENTVDLMQELHVRGAVDESLDFDGMIFEIATDNEAAVPAILTSEQRCWRVEYNPYAKITKIFDSASQILNVYNYAQGFKENTTNLNTSWEEMFDPTKSSSVRLKSAQTFFNSLNYVVAYVPGEEGQQLRQIIGQSAGFFGDLYNVQDYINNFDQKMLETKTKLMELEDQIRAIPEDLVEAGSDLKFAITDNILGINLELHGMADDLDVSKCEEASTKAASGTLDAIDAKERGDYPALYQFAQQVKDIYRTLEMLCSFSNDDFCEQVREFKHSDFMKAITLGTLLYDFLSYSKCVEASGGIVCDNGYKIPKGTALAMGVNNILADELFVEVWSKDTGEVVYSEDVFVPPPDPVDPWKAPEVKADWNWRTSAGHYAKPGEYGVRATYTDLEGKQKVVDVLGQNDIDYPIAPGELYEGLFDEQLLGKAQADTFFNVDAGYEFLSFEFDFGSTRGAFAVVSVELQVYDANDVMIWHETRQMPVLGDNDSRGYDNTFIWNLRNIDTGETVEDGTYTFRLLTTMQSGKQHVSYFNRDVVRTDPTAPPPEPEATPAVTRVRIPDPGMDRYMNYKFDANGVVTGSTDSFGNAYTFERDANGFVSGAVYPDGSSTDYFLGPNSTGNMPSLVTDRNGNQVNYSYGPDDKIQGMTDGFGNSMSFAYPEPGKTAVTDQAGRTIVKTLNDMGLPTNILYPDGTQESNEFDGFGNLKKNVDPVGRVTVIDYNDNDQPLSVKDNAGNITVYHYDAAYNLREIIDPLGNSTTMTYDSVGNVLTATDPEGRTVTTTYDAANRPLTVKDPAGFTTTYTYDPAAGTLSSVLFPDGTSVSYTYYAEEPRNNLIKTMTDARSNTWAFEYDARRNATKVTDPLNREASFTYNIRGQTLTATDFAGRTVTYHYRPADGKLTEIVDPAGNITKSTYDAAGNVKTVTDARGFTTTYNYDDMDRVREIVDHQGHKIIYTYYDDGQVETVTDRKGRTARFEYDAAGRLWKAYDAAGNVIEYGYDAAGNLKTVKNQLGKITTYNYDRSGLLTSVTDPLGHVSRYRYNSRGLLEEAEDAEGHVSRTLYDNMGRVKTETDPLGNTASYTYDANGNVETVTDPKTFVYSYQYDALDRVIVARDPKNQTTLYDYDPETGLSERITDAKGNNTTFGYDALGRMNSLCNHFNQCASYTHDALGNTETVTNRRGQTVTYTYDYEGRVKTKLFPAYGNLPAYSASFVYDENGNLLHAEDNVSGITYTYDILDRVDTVTTTGPDMPTAAIDYDYYNDGALMQTVGPNGTIGYQYDDAGRLRQMDTPAGIFTWDYYDRDLIKALHYPNGITAKYEYDDAGQILLLDNVRSDNSYVTKFHYTYDANGNRDTITDLDGTHAYGYDPLNQLTSADHPETQAAYNPDENYDYDALGNRDTSHISTNYRVNELNQLQEDDTYFYDYDDDGNLTTKTEKANPSNITIYTFDPENRLVRVDLPGSETVTFKYDIMGRRIEKNESGQVQRYVYDGYNIAVEFGLSNSQTFSYMYAPIIDDILCRTETTQSIYYHKDALLSVISLTDINDIVKQTYKYDSFGNIIESDGNISDNYITFSGREFDISDKSLYYRARYYQPLIGRFTSQDVVFSNNVYNFVNNNPLNYTDPLGLAPVVDQPNGASVNPIYFAGRVICNEVLSTSGNVVSSTCNQSDYRALKRNTWQKGMQMSSTEYNVYIMSPIGCKNRSYEMDPETGRVCLHTILEGGGNAHVVDVPGLDLMIDILTGGGAFVVKGGIRFIGAYASRELGEYAVGQLERASVKLCGKTLFKEALEGGAHANLIRVNRGKPRKEIEKGIRSLERRGAQHIEKIIDPEKYVPGFKSLTSDHQKSILRNWAKEVINYRSQAEILRGLLH